MAKKLEQIKSIIQYAKNCVNKGKEIYPLIYYCEYKEAGCHSTSHCPYYNIKYNKPKNVAT